VPDRRREAFISPSRWVGPLRADRITQKDLQAPGTETASYGTTVFLGGTTSQNSGEASGCSEFHASRELLDIRDEVHSWLVIDTNPVGAM